MIIDCHGHFTTAPPALGQWREKQIRAFEESGARLPADELQISDDEIVTVIEQGHSSSCRRRRDGTDVALSSRPGPGRWPTTTATKRQAGCGPGSAMTSSRGSAGSFPNGS